MTAIRIGGRTIAPGQPCFLIAEAGVNHNGRLEAALQLVDAAKDSGADAVKFQTFRTESLVVSGAPKAKYQIEHTGADESQDMMLRKLELSPEAHQSIADYCGRRGIVFLSSPFDEGSADLLEELNVPAFKLGSGEITNLPLLAHVARHGKPVILSTGMCGLGEVEAAIAAIEGAGNSQIVLLHCVSEYPADPSHVNLRAIGTLATAFHAPAGYSDHTPGIEIALAAAAVGACVIEKHLTLDRTLPGPDQPSSCEPAEFRQLVSAIRNIEAALGDGRKRPSAGEADTAAFARKSLVAAAAIPAGAAITGEMLAAKRPGTGLPPALRTLVIGRTSRRAISAGEVLSFEMLS